MGFFSGNIYSASMRMETQVNVILPQDGRNYTWDQKPKTLILLHGLSDNASTWMRLSSIERYAQMYNLAVVMPEVQRSWYQDNSYGMRMFTYIAEELPKLMEKMFQVSVRREDLMIAGWSMGGYGALRCSLTFPERFSCCGALSGAYDLSYMLKCEDTLGADEMKRLREEYQAIFGENTKIPDERDIFLLIEKDKKEGKIMPNVFMSSGTSDYLYPVFQKVRKMCEENITEYHAEEYEGAHEWRVCDKAVERMLKYFLGNEKSEE